MTMWLKEYQNKLKKLEKNKHESSKPMLAYVTASEGRMIERGEMPKPDCRMLLISPDDTPFGIKSIVINR